MRFSFKATFRANGKIMNLIQFHSSHDKAIRNMSDDIRREYPEAEIVDISRCADPRLRQLLDAAVEVS